MKPFSALFPVTCCTFFALLLSVHSASLRQASVPEDVLVSSPSSSSSFAHLSSLRRKSSSPPLATNRSLTASTTSVTIAPLPVDPASLVSTSQGSIQGIVYADVYLYLGIPYAKPPTGNRRFRPPKPASPHKGVYTANYLHPFCAQPCFGNCFNFFGIPAAVSEDCLFLNVFTPKKRPSKAKYPDGYPVYFWIHGGGSIVGSGIEQAFLIHVENDIVVVTINYRLGVFSGFLNDNLDGNNAILDQQLALRWVIDNIANFGGNPRHITIGGISAGGHYTSCHLTIPSSRDLFQYAVMQSADIGSGGLELRTYEETRVYSEKLALYVGCQVNDYACLANLPWLTLLQAFGEMFDLLDFAALTWFGQAPNGKRSIVPKPPTDAMAAGEVNPVRGILAGVDRSEGFSFLEDYGPLDSLAAYLKLIFRMTTTKPSRALQLYPYDFAKNNGYDSFGQLNTDRGYFCPLRRGLLGAARALPRAKIFAFVFAYFSPTCSSGFPEQCTSRRAVCHTAHNDYVAHLLQVTCPAATSEDLAMEYRMSGHWINFLHTGDVNQGPFQLQKDYPAWPRYGPEQRSFYRLQTNDPDPLIGDIKQRECRFWDSLPYTGYVL